MVIEFKGKALGMVTEAIKTHELTWPQAYMWYVFGYSRDAMGEKAHTVDTQRYAALLGVSPRSIRHSLQVLQAKGLIEKVQGGSFEAAAYRLR